VKLTHEQIQAYRDQGFLLVERCFAEAELDRVRADLPDAFAEDSPRRVLERDGVTVRGVHGQHDDFASFGHLVRHPRLVEPVRQLLGGPIYIYQFKINVKASLTGEAWPWHQDFIFWQREDGMPRAELVTALVMLDDTTEFNGPLLVLAGSHHEGCISVESRAARKAAEGPTWVNNLTADLKYALPHDRVRDLGTRYPITSIKAPAGSVLFFHPNLVHGSTDNLSPRDRRLALATYCHTANQVRPVPAPRPAFLSNRNPTPIEPAHDGILLDEPAR
jgi:ectoine hydroxylase